MKDNGAVEVDVGSISAMKTNHLVSWDEYARNLDDGMLSTYTTNLWAMIIKKLKKLGQ